MRTGLAALSALAAAACAGGDAACEAAAAGVSVGTIDLTALEETSGLVASRTQQVLWAHNDAGSGAKLYALGLDAVGRGSFEVLGADAVDWEDLALGEGPDGSPQLLIGDIGDNEGTRQSVALYLVDEPAVALTGTAVDSVVSAVRVELTWPDGPHDAEGLAWDPVADQVLVFTKEEGGFGVYAAPPEDGALRALSWFGLDGLGVGDKVTAADVSPGGEYLLVATTDGALRFDWPVGASVEDVLASAPCPVPIEEPAEALAAAADGAYDTAAEGTQPALYAYPAP